MTRIMLFLDLLSDQREVIDKVVKTCSQTVNSYIENGKIKKVKIVKNIWRFFNFWK